MVLLLSFENVMRRRLMGKFRGFKVASLFIDAALLSYQW